MFEMFEMLRSMARGTASVTIPGRDQMDSYRSSIVASAVAAATP